MKNYSSLPSEEFDRLYDQYYQPVVAYFSRRHNPSDAEDLAQITFFKLWQYIPSLNTIRNEKSLIFKIAKNVLIDKKRREKFTENIDDIKNLEYYCDFSNVEIQSVLSSLEFRDREIIALRQDGFSSREIAKIQGVAPSTIRSRLQNIRKYVSAELRLDVMFGKKNGNAKN